MTYFEKRIRDGNNLEVFKTQLVSFTDEGYEVLIPKDPGNSDYQNYLTWVADGNTAEVIYNDSEYRIAHGYEEA